MGLEVVSGSGDAVIISVVDGGVGRRVRVAKLVENVTK